MSAELTRRPPSYRWHLAALALAAMHHIDHVLRAAHVGWPATADVNTFTYTLAIYPLIALGFLLRSARYWLAVAIGGIVMLSMVHIAIEPPAEILGGHAQPLAGLLAFAILIALIVVLTVIAFRYAVLVGMRPLLGQGTQDQVKPDLGSVFADEEVVRLYRNRAPYPDAAIEALRKLIVEPRVVLDAGAGSGAIARRLAPFAERVDAVDPSRAMLESGRGLPGGDDTRIKWIEGRAEDVELRGPYGLITCGASLHWMSTDRVMPRFRGALAPGALVAVADVDVVHGPYRDDVLAVIREHSEIEDHRETKDLVASLRAEGRFELVGDETTAPVPFEQSVDDYIEMLHSTSTLARVRLGARAARFDEQLRVIFARHGLDRVRYDVVGRVWWGRPR